MLTHVLAPKQLWQRVKHAHLSQKVLRNCPSNVFKRKMRQCASVSLVEA